MRDHLKMLRVASPSCFIPQTEHVTVWLELVPLLPIFRECEEENPYMHIKENEEMYSMLQD